MAKSVEGEARRIFLYMVLCASIQKVKSRKSCFYLLVSVKIGAPAEKSVVLTQHKDMQETKSTQLVYPRYVGVYTLHASCVPGKYVNILNMEQNEEAVFLL